MFLKISISILFLLSSSLANACCDKSNLFQQISHQYRESLNEALIIRNKNHPEPRDYEMYCYYLGKAQAFDECLECFFPEFWVTDDTIYLMMDFVED